MHVTGPADGGGGPEERNDVNEANVRHLAAIEAIRRAKARYFRGVDTGDAALTRSVLAEDCVLDYRGCCTDPASGRDYLPTMNIVVNGRSAWSEGGLRAAGIVSLHQGFNADIVPTSDDTATAVWGMTDQLWMPVTAPFRYLRGCGFYHETYVREEGEWRIATLRIERIRVEVD
jgi:hypothetical protein